MDQEEPPRPLAEPQLTPGATYLLDDFTYVQVEEIVGDEVRYRARQWAWSWPWHWRHRLVSTIASLDAMSRRVRAEVDGDFFPDLSEPGRRRFERPASQIAGLRAFLAERSTHRPFSPPG